jgi:hypothetical protein
VPPNASGGGKDVHQGVVGGAASKRRRQGGQDHCSKMIENYSKMTDKIIKIIGELQNN